MHISQIPTQKKCPRFIEFILLMAIISGLVAISIDHLLPAFGEIATEFAIEDGNKMQMLIYIFMLSFALMQIVYGPLTDSFGRKKILISGLLIYAVGTLMGAFSNTFEDLLISRFIQGIGASASRVLTTAIIRDCFKGAEMAKVMSFIMMVFIILPVFAPYIGNLILIYSNWHMIFINTFFITIIITVWYTIRMPETLPSHLRHKNSFSNILDSIKNTIQTRQTIGYATAVGTMFACIMSYIGSAQQIFQTEVYHLGNKFPIIFGSIAACMGFASFINARFVCKIGMQKLSYYGIVVMIISSTTNLVIAYIFKGIPPLPIFTIGLTITLFCFSVTMPNFSTLAIEPLGYIAGTASSIIGLYSTLIGVVCGAIIGQSFNGTVIPLITGHLILATSTFIIVTIIK